MAEMKTDHAALDAEGRTFDRIATDLKAQIQQVESTAQQLQSQWRGAAGQAAQQAVLRFQEAGNKQKAELDDIAANLTQAGVHYQRADDEQSQTLSAQMNF